MEWFLLVNNSRKLKTNDCTYRISDVIKTNQAFMNSIKKSTAQGKKYSQ